MLSDRNANKISVTYDNMNCILYRASIPHISLHAPKNFSSQASSFRECKARHMVSKPYTNLQNSESQFLQSNEL